MSDLSKEEVEHIAKLANLSLSEEEKDKFASQLTEILNYVEKISSVNTNNERPLFNVLGLKNIFRDDEVRPSLLQEEALKNSRDIYKGYFKVKAIFE